MIHNNRHKVESGMPSAVGGLWGERYGIDTLGRPCGGRTLGRLGERGGAPADFRAFPFRSRRGVGSYAIAGTARDANGNALGGATVMLFETGTDKLVSKLVSEAITGVFAFLVRDRVTTHYAVFYKAGSPDVAGTTVNTLTGV